MLFGLVCEFGCCVVLSDVGVCLMCDLGLCMCLAAV